MFASILYKDDEFPNLPYDLNSQEIKALPMDKYYHCGLITMGFHVKEAFTAYTLLMPYVFFPLNIK